MAIFRDFPCNNALLGFLQLTSRTRDDEIAPRFHGNNVKKYRWKMRILELFHPNFWRFLMWEFPKIGYPQIIHSKNRVFQYFHHPFWGENPYFWKHPCVCFVGLCFRWKIDWEELEIFLELLSWNPMDLRVVATFGRVVWPPGISEPRTSFFSSRKKGGVVKLVVPYYNWGWFVRSTGVNLIYLDHPIYQLVTIHS